MPSNTIPAICKLSVDDVIFLFENRSVRVKTGVTFPTGTRRARYSYLRDVRNDREVVECEGEPTQSAVLDVFEQYPNAQVNVLLPAHKFRVLTTFGEFLRFRVKIKNPEKDHGASYFLKIPHDRDVLNRMELIQKYRSPWYNGRGRNKIVNGYVVPLMVFDKSTIRRIKLLVPDYRERLIYNRYDRSYGIKDSEVVSNLKALKVWGLL